MNCEIEFLKVFFREIERNRIEYAVLRNVEEIITGDAHDIDMAIDFSKWNLVVGTLKHTAENLGWKFHFYCEKDSGNLITIHLFKIVEGLPTIVHFDFFKAFGWNGYELLGYKKLYKGRSLYDWVYTASEPIQVVTMLFSRYLYQGYIKEKYRLQIKITFIERPREVKTLMRSFLSNAFVDAIYFDVITEEWNNIEQERYAVQRDVVSSIEKHQKGAFTKMKLFKVRRLLHHPGIIINLTPENHGDIEKLQNYLSRTFPSDSVRLKLIGGGYSNDWKSRIKTSVEISKGYLIFTDVKKHSNAYDLKPGISPETAACEILELMSRRYADK